MAARRWLFWVVPLAVASLGVAVTFMGFAYDLAFAGIPYQDPTPDMESRWRYHSGVASAIEFGGVILTLLGFATLAFFAVWSLVKRQF